MNAEQRSQIYARETILATVDDIVQANCAFILRDLEIAFIDWLNSTVILQFANAHNVDVYTLTEHICYVLCLQFRNPTTAIQDNRGKVRRKSSKALAAIYLDDDSELPDEKILQDLQISPELFALAVKYLKK